MSSTDLQEKINYLHISPDEQKPEIEAVCWHHTITILNDYRFQFNKHIDSRTLWKSTQAGDWWKPYEDVEKLTIIGDIPSYDFISHLKRLTSLSIINSTTFNSLSVIEGLQELEFLQVISCHQVKDITPIITLRNMQKEKTEQEKQKREAESPGEFTGFIHYNALSNINLTDCNISSLEPFRADKGLRLDELHLRYNSIENIKPLGVLSNVYLDLSHNHVKDISSLFSSKERNYYGINLRHNLIKDISGIRINEVRIPSRIKIWIGHNQIPSQQLEKWRKDDYIWIMDV